MLTAKSYKYSFEIETILTQFVAMLDKCIVRRYSKNKDTGERVVKSTVEPRFVFGTKSRVSYFLVNKAKNVTYPVVVITLNSIQLDKERLASKFDRVMRGNGEKVEGYDRPTPITISLAVNIITTIQTDLYQIFGKISTQFQPEQFYSWCVPGTKEMVFEELRNKVEWDGSFSIDSREQLSEGDEEIYKGTMNFSVQGWLFPEEKKDTDKLILDIGTTIPLEPDTFYRTSGLYGTYHPFVCGSDTPYTNPKEWNNGHPRAMLLYHNKNGVHFRVTEDSFNSFNLQKSYNLVIHGYNLDNVKVYFVPKGEHELELKDISYEGKKLMPYLGTTTEKEKHLRGLELEIKEQTQNEVSFKLSDINYTGDFDIIVTSPFDWDTLNINYKAI